MFEEDALEIYWNMNQVEDDWTLRAIWTCYSINVMTVTIYDYDVWLLQENIAFSERNINLNDIAELGDEHKDFLEHTLFYNTSRDFVVKIWLELRETWTRNTKFATIDITVVAVTFFASDV